MPYISESKRDDASSVQRYFGANGLPVPSRDRTVPSMYRNRSQYGWRSHNEKQAAVKQLNAVQDDIQHWGQQRQLIDALDRVERSLADPLIPDRGEFPVNDRNFTDDRHTGLIQPRLYMADGRSAIPTMDVTFGRKSGSLDHSETQIQSMAGQMMRQSAPTTPEANLGQWFGELRDANRLFSGGEAANFATTSGTTRAVGGAYLNWQFGWKGFLGDLYKSAEAILNSEKLVEEFLLNSYKLHHRTREKILDRGAVTIPIAQIVCNSFNDVNVTVQSPVGSLSCRWNPYMGLSSSAGPRASGYVSTTWTEYVRSFAMFEYFAMDPDGALSRMQGYYQKARHLLGNSLVSASTLYELAPWSWMGDWFVDIGGLLAFQESVSTDRLVTRQSGSVYGWKVDNHLHLTATGPGTPRPNLGWSGNATSSYKFERRRAGTPYDMGNSWDGFSTSQWFILGALGMTRAPRVPAGR